MTLNDFPCTGCITSIPGSYKPGVPAKLLLSLHGDEGSPGISHGFWYQAAMDNDYILVAPQCPSDLGCTGKWETGSWHPQGQNGSVAWLHAQLDAVAAKYTIDSKREYVAGGSGGAVYLGYHADSFVPRVAGVAMVSGGYSSITQTCPSCSALPVYILIGDKDYLLSLGEKARDWFTACGSEVKYDLLPGVDHQGAGEALKTGKGDAILSWFSARPNKCP